MCVVIFVSQLILVLFSLILPLVFLTLYGYVKKGGWKPIMWGIVDSISALFLVRMVIPLLVFNQTWFQMLLANTPLYITVYSLSMALVYMVFGWIYFFRLHKNNDKRLWNDEGKSRGLVFGFSEGFAYEALFIGFNGLSSLLSDYAPVIDEGQASGIWLSILEALTMIVLFSTFSIQLQQAQSKKNSLGLVLTFGEIFLFFWLGFSWQSVWGLPRTALEVVLILASLLAIWWINKQGLFQSLFTVEQEEPMVEEPLSTKDILALRKKS